MITLECIGHDTSFELENTIHLFKPYVEQEYTVLSRWEEKEQLASTQLTTVTGEVIAHVEERIVQCGEAIADKKERKLVLKGQLYQLLQQLTGQSMPWGILTGIRPTKIVHEYHKKGYTEAAIRMILAERYAISAEKIDLMVQVAKAEEAILAQNKPKEISVYIGIPFCPTRCVYCSFTAYSLEKKGDQVDAYVEALCKEISYIATSQADRPIRSLYIGGGTPTSLNEAQLERLLVHIANSFALDEIAEYTIEAGRPDTITKEKLRLMKAYGVGRISINPQSMNQKTLDAIGRAHGVESIREVFQVAREVGHDNINMDIILGLPGETPEDVAYTLAELKKLGPENVTVHTMAIKKTSILQQNQADYVLSEAKKIEEMLALSKVGCKEMGLVPYYMYRQKNMLGNFENVGYAKPGTACIYNIEIMEEKESILAAGAGAVTKIVHQQGERIERVPNVKNLEDYISRIEEMIARKETAFHTYEMD